jgi:hypothetical protein
MGSTITDRIARSKMAGLSDQIVEQEERAIWTRIKNAVAMERERCSAVNRAFEMTTERQIQKAVDEVLNTNEWPIYRTQDDNGLEAHEYFEFAKAVLRKLEQR